MSDLQPFEKRSADHLRLVLESSQIGIWELELQSGQAVRNFTHDRIFGYDQPLASWSYDRFLEHIVDDDRARVDNLQRTAIEQDREWSFECQILTAIGEKRWIRAAGRPLKDAGSKVVKLIGHVIDITESKQDEARLRLMTGELSHRVRNMLAMIKSMISISARGARDIPSFAQALEGRVGALARTHQLLVEDAPASMMPAAILRTELTAFSGIEDRVAITATDETPLTPSASQNLALIYHELLTNAMKHGALSSQEGRVDVQITGSDGTIDIDWKERGGPPVQADRPQGFGSVLIGRVLAADGTTRQVFAPQGVECHITLNG